MTEQQEATAVLAALNTALAPKVAYELDAVPATRPANYVEVTVSRRFGGEERAARKGSTGWRITTRAVSRYVSDARLMHEKSRTALEYVRLSVGGKSSTPVQFETEVPVQEDDGWFSGLISWTYVR